ncbi:hypothetical protein [Aneurinibacillus aneurinilyticus]|uniref:Uncharacterized protein n=1 Tax=Aneurinibacillus aneurinilyticus TaxID=1391 RepID=A0A848D1S4_ANEAE|nr:hypothetical protein [Aneurinibacillus aneurinilyticus]NMF00038.1 hypothetical protein [Aneurinibacillus aneurinilyticus]
MVDRVVKWLDFIAYGNAATELNIDVHELLGEDEAFAIADAFEKAFPNDGDEDLLVEAIKIRLMEIATELLKEAK